MSGVSLGRVKVDTSSESDPWARPRPQRTESEKKLSARSFRKIPQSGSERTFWTVVTVMVASLAALLYFGV